MSSDVSAAPAVLRRWSGASEMGIDLGTPASSSSVSSVSQSKKPWDDTSSDVVETKVGTNHGTQLTGSSFEPNKLTFDLERIESNIWEDQTCRKTQSGSSFSTAEGESMKDRGNSQFQLRSLPYGRTGTSRSTDQRRFKDSLDSWPDVRSLGEVEGPGSSSKERRMKFEKPGFSPEIMKKSESSRRDESDSDYGNSRPVFSGKMVSGGQEVFGSVPIVSRGQVERVRQSKGNQELYDELKMKANELEKLFAEHKLRVPGEKLSSSRRNGPADVQIEQAAASMPHRKPPAEISPAQLPDKSAVTESSGSFSNVSQFSATPPVKVLDDQDQGDAVMQNFYELGLSDDSRGKFYENYMQKRDAKLRGEWGSKRAEKEAKMKAIEDSIERRTEEMKDKFSGSARRHAERLRSFNTRSTMKRDQHPIGLLRNEDAEELSDFAEQKPFDHDRSFSETSFGKGVPKSSQAKKLPNKSLPSSIPRTSAAPVPRSSIKTSNSSTGRRKMQSENPLAQSVPNFSDLRKENTKPSSEVTKTMARQQTRMLARSKSTNEDISVAKEERPPRSPFVRKSTASPAEFKDLSPLDSDLLVLTPLKFDKEQPVHGVYDKFLKNGVSKPFLKKGSGVGPGAGAAMAKMKTSMESGTINNEEESDVMAFEPEESLDAANNEDDKESEVTITEDHANVDNGKARLSDESEKFVNSGSESGDASRSSPQEDPSFVAELLSAVPPTFHPVGSVQQSPAESPVSWNSRMQRAFSYAHETSDIDASVDSPMGSPASWNSHSLNQAEADAVRMRKKWGSAQRPVIGSNSSHGHSRMDVTKGFKRFLQFGRKSRGTDTLVDWISATTSEGDDNSEDGRDPAKSRMGFSLGHPSDDSFNKREFFSEQVQALRSSIPTPPVNFKLRDDHLSESSIKAPRSFFSLSSFRSKGSHSKPR